MGAGLVEEFLPVGWVEALRNPPARSDETVHVFGAEGKIAVIGACRRRKNCYSELPVHLGPESAEIPDFWILKRTEIEDALPTMVSWGNRFSCRLWLR